MDTCANGYFGTTRIVENNLTSNWLNYTNVNISYCKPCPS
jgi:hypothetical protein